MEVIVDYDVLFELNFRPGDFLVKGIEIGKIHSERILEDKETAKILSQFVIGDVKATQQDLEFSIRQLVEIAARALSPGVNDPFTAIGCIDNLTAT